MNEIYIDKIEVLDNCITYQYRVMGDWKKYFSENNRFMAAYDYNIQEVPESILVLPILGSLLIMASLFHGKIYVNTIDKSFYECVQDLINGYEKMSPQLSFARNIIYPEKIVDNQAPASVKRSLAFFSGGVDAWSTLLSHLEEKPAILSIWGNDVPFDREEEWSVVFKQNRDMAHSLELPFYGVRSNLRTFIKEQELNEWSFEKVNDNWWSAFQHSLGMLCLAAPLSMEGFHTIYFGASYCDHGIKGTYVIASDPSIDNYLRMADARVIHDGYEYSRIEKVERICRFSIDNHFPLKIRTCYKSLSGDNCGVCENCAHVIMMLKVLGFSPEQFGFSYESEEQLIEHFLSGFQGSAREEVYAARVLYTDTQSKMRKWYRNRPIPKKLHTFLREDMEDLVNFLHVTCNQCQEDKELLTWYREETIGKQWLDGEYHKLQAKVLELEDECDKRGSWIHKLEEDKKWLTGQQSKKKKNWWTRLREKR